MPNALTTLICPETIPHPQTIRQLLLFFPTVFHYRPVEEEQAGEGVTKGDVGYAPAPFADDLGKFQKLLAELKSHRDEFLSGYLAALSQPPGVGRDEDSTRKLLARLGRGELEEVPDEELWQARLLLKLAELKADGEQALARELARSAAQEQLLFARLLGEEPAPEPPAISLPLPPSPAVSERLLKAWGQLYLADPAPHRPWLLTTANREAFALLLEEQTRQGGGEPQKIFSLTLPATAGPELDPRREALHLALREIANDRAIISTSLFAPELGARFAPERERWEMQVRELGGESTEGSQLQLYLLPHTPLPALFARLCRRPAVETATPPLHGIMGLLS